MSDICDLNIKETHAALKNRDFSCTELTKEYFRRIKDKDPLIKSYLTITESQALDQARVIDNRIAMGDFNDLLSGIPYSVKDIIATKGVKTTAASKILKDYIAVYNATVVDRVGGKGGVMLGKVNCDAFAHGASCENSDFFPTHNPWDLDRVPGGSSGGSAAGVAAGLAAYSLATDTGGSIRYPASHCGVTGLKPSYGRVSRYGILSMTSSTDSPGIIAGSVSDLASVLSVIAGKDNKDAVSRRKEVPDYAAKLDKGGLKGKKIGIPKEYFAKGLSDKVEKVISKALTKMEDLGAELVDIELPHSQYAVAVYYIITPSEISSNLARYDGIKYGYSLMRDNGKKDAANDLFEVYSKSRRYGFGDEAKRRIMIGTYVLSAGYYDAYYKKASAVRYLIADDFKKAYKKVDLIACPVSPNTAFKIGEKVSDPLSLYLEDVYLSAVSLAGLPAISLPCGFAAADDDDSKKLPVGLQLIGKYFQEEYLLSAGYAYEQATSWHKQRPADISTV